MTPQDDEIRKFYENRVEAHRQLYNRENAWDRLSQPTVVVSVLILLLTFSYNTYGSNVTINGIISLLKTCIWDGLVYILPARLIYALDSRANPAASLSMLRGQDTGHAAKSEALRRVMGLDSSDGMMASVFKARSRALSVTSTVLGLKGDSDRPPGLGNRDNSCYQNSILQGLSSLKSLPEYLSYHLQHADMTDSSRDVAQTLRSLISDLNDTSNYGKTLWTPSLLKSMSSWTQQDAQEYYSKILDDMDKSIAKAMSKTERHPGFEMAAAKDDSNGSQHSDDSGYQSLSSSRYTEVNQAPKNPLEGLLAQRVACVQCGHTDGLSMIPFTCLTLSLGLHKHQHDLYERLDAYTKVEPIENVECAKCTLLKAQRLLTKLVERMRKGNTKEEQLAEPLRRLEAVERALEEDDFEEKTLSESCKITAQGKVSSTKTKQMVIARPPQSLAVHVNRSVFDPTTFDMIKNSAPVNFPLTLDLGPWCLGSSGQASAPMASAEKPNESDAEQEERHEDEEQWPSNPRASMIAGDLRPSRLTGPIYELRAVVTHYGRHDNGHYICYRKYPRATPPQHTPPLDDGSAPREQDASEPDASEPEVTLQETAQSNQGTGSKECDEIEWDWWRLSDHNVSKVDDETVMSLSPGVFMLFYDCVDPNTVLSSEDFEMHDASEESTRTPVEYGAETVEEEEEAAKDSNDDAVVDDDDSSLSEPIDVVAQEGNLANSALTPVESSTVLVGVETGGLLDAKPTQAPLEQPQHQTGGHATETL